jgi:hypothetical protein
MIVHGTKIVVRRIGHVADFCPMCRELRVFRLSRVGLASHLYFLSFGEGKLVAHTLECLTCGVSFETDPLRYTTPQKHANADVEAMIQRTIPDLRSLYGERLKLEIEIRKSPRAIPPEKRMEMILEPFRLLSPTVEKRFEASTQMDKESGIGCLATFIVPVLILWGAHLLGKMNGAASAGTFEG